MGHPARSKDWEWQVQGPRTPGPKRSPSQQRRRRQRDARLIPHVESAATTSLVLGLVGLLVCGLAAPFAILKGNEARDMARRARVPTPAGATAGVVLGWLTLAAVAMALFVWLTLFSSLVVLAPR